MQLGETATVKASNPKYWHFMTHWRDYLGLYKLKVVAVMPLTAAGGMCLAHNVHGNVPLQHDLHHAAVCGATCGS